jgi:hypothetical protein
LFNNTGRLEPNTFVLCDVFGRKAIPVGGKLVKAGAPILYYRANTSSKTLDYANISFDKLIYNCSDNEGFVVYVKELADQAQYPSLPTPVNPLADITNNRRAFYEYITDPKVKVTNVDWPYRPDSYILISAGADGLYGTSDDIRNF